MSLTILKKTLKPFALSSLHVGGAVLDEVNRACRDDVKSLLMNP